MADQPVVSYSIDEHRHRFAAWAAGRAASVIGCRFSVETAKSIIESVALNALVRGPECLPDPASFDGAHAAWRTTAISYASELGLPFTHGVAAKLINVYLKAVFVCGGHHDDERVAAVHPPIDGLLLDALARCNLGEQGPVWRRARNVRWSNLNSDQYQELIDAIRIALGGEPLWRLEEHWRGYQ